MKASPFLKLVSYWSVRLSLVLLCWSVKCQSLWTEAWQAAQVRTYAPTDATYDTIFGDRGAWIVYDSAFDCNGEPHPNTAKIVASGANKSLTLTVVANDCVTDLSVDLFTSPNIPVTTNTLISFTETGSLSNPNWNGFFPTLFPPPGDNIHLFLLDQNKNGVVYIFQRTPQYPPHTTTLQVQFPDGHAGSAGYHEVFLDSYNAAGGTYVRNLFQDFSRAPGFKPSGAVVSYISFSVSGVGTATFDDLKIGSAIPVTLPVITSQPQTATVPVGSNVTFTVSASGTAPLSFQWRKNRAPLFGATAASLTLNNIFTNQSGDYTVLVLVSNAAGSVSSQVATLTVTVPVSAPLIESAIYAAGAINLRWHALAGRTYHVQFKDDLNQASWSLLAPIVGTGKEVTLVDPSASLQRFYRIVLLP